ncbi:MAG: GTP 3',8-cyclase MoaA [Clostridiales Family XIII bacterium]|jgi:cyclic pyranopterin phosphate synthase|nr:GTP 3',8-cyclase MoaA [Clostridiales Family XIII bacterium]
MRDETGRNIRYLRLSVTDRCNLRCLYCMPSEGVNPLSHSDILTFEEILRLVRLATDLGIDRVKVTGGEPLVRRGVVDLIRGLKALPKIDQVTLTTNGALLEEYLPALVDAGTDGVNISIDTLNREVYAKLTGFDDLARVLSSIRRAAEVLPVKLNVVPLEGVNDGELCDLAEMARRDVLAVRFIELMPVGRAERFSYPSSDSVKSAIETCFGSAEPCEERLGNGPAVYYRLENFEGKIGFIRAMSDSFCADCNRVRLTADGRFMPCLGRSDFADAKRVLRDGASDLELTKSLERTIFAKPTRHGFAEGRQKPGRDMHMIGG